MRGTKHAVLISGLFLCGCAYANDGTARQARPNFIVILADDMGYGDCGCYGSATIQTPNLDALARSGVRFTDFHSNGAVCSPTRAALLTGRYQQRGGVDGVLTAAKHRHTGLSLTETTFATLLREVGYKTALFGKWKLVADAKAKRGVSLYNLAEDLAEKHDLADPYPEVIEDLQKKLAEWEKDVASGG